MTAVVFTACATRSVLPAPRLKLKMGCTPMVKPDRGMNTSIMALCRMVMVPTYRSPNFPAVADQPLVEHHDDGAFRGVDHKAGHPQGHDGPENPGMQADKMPFQPDGAAPAG